MCDKCSDVSQMLKNKRERSERSGQLLNNNKKFRHNRIA